MTWQKLRYEMNQARSSGVPSPLQLSLQKFVSPEIAEAVEKDICPAIEYYENFDVEVEKESYPRIKRLAEDLLKAIQKTRSVEIYARRNYPTFKAFLQWTSDYATRLSEQYPPRKQWKERGRAPMLVSVIVKTLDANGVKLSKYDSKYDDSGTLVAVVRTVFASLQLPHQDVRRRIIPKALKNFQNRKVK